MAFASEAEETAVVEEEDDDEEEEQKAVHAERLRVTDNFF